MLIKTSFYLLFLPQAYLAISQSSLAIIANISK